MLVELKNLFNRTDIPSMILEYDTTFNLGNYYMSWLTFRFTEFCDLPNNPMPTIGLACFIHKSKTQSVHEYFWNILHHHIPELNEASNVLICTDEEYSIVNAIKKVCLEL